MCDVDKQKSPLHLTLKEKKLIQLIRSTQKGELKIMVKDKQPVKVDKVIRDFEL